MGRAIPLSHAIALTALYAILLIALVRWLDRRYMRRRKNRK